LISTSTHTPAPAAAASPSRFSDPVPRAVAIIALIGVAAIHLAQVVPTVQQTPYLGAAFVALTLSCMALAGWLLVAETAAGWAAVAGLNALAIAGYAFTRTFSTFFDNQDVGNWDEMLGLVALLIEGVLIGLSLLQLHRSRPTRVPI
jgi:hypothetical protein